MLIRFNVKNFLTFSARQDGRSEEFSMLAGKDKNKCEHVLDDGTINLLKFAAIYGANAAGKSSLIKAIRFMQNAILNNSLPDGYSGLYCKVNPSNKKKPTYLEMEIKLGDNYYSYGFEVLLSEGKFLSEWLIKLSPNSEEFIFSREIQTGKYKIFDKGDDLDAKLRDRLEIYVDDIRHDSTTLFLPTMNRNKDELYKEYASVSVFRDVFDWFKKKLDVTYPQQPVSRYSYLVKVDEKKVKEVCNKLEAFGTGITGCKMVEVKPEEIYVNIPPIEERSIKSFIEEAINKGKFKKSKKSAVFVRNSNGMFIIAHGDEGEQILCTTIKFEHNHKSELFNTSEESDGTVRLFDLIEILLGNEEKTYVIDELDRCLHPSLTYHFVKMYLEAAKKRNTQLIVTTHESRLMDFDLLRRDEIWLINKGKDGTADVYSLDEYNVRFDKNVDKAYLEGRYDGVPLFTTLFPVKEA